MGYLRRGGLVVAGFLTVVLLVGPGVQASISTRAATAAPTEQWVDSWAASYLSTTVNGAVQAAPSFNNQTLRLNVFSKLGGTQVRVKLTNKFATNTLKVGAAHVRVALDLELHHRGVRPHLDVRRPGRCHPRARSRGLE